MYTFPTAPRSVWGVIQDGTCLYRKIFKRVFAIAIIAALVMFSFLVLLQHLLQAAIMPHPGQPAVVVTSLLVAFGVIFLLFICMGYFKSVLIYLSGKLAQDDLPKCGSAWLFALRKYPLVFVTGVIIFFLVSLGLGLLLLPGIFLFCLLMFAPVAILLDNDDVFASIKRSARLVWGHWWRTFAVILFVIIVQAFVTYLFRLFGAHVLRLEKLSVSFHLLLMVPFVLIWPWMISIVIEQYYDLKLRYQLKRQSND